MVNHPNRSKSLKWTRDGDQWVATGTLGEYRITEWCVASGKNFVIRFKSKRSSKGIGEFSSLENAKAAVQVYDGYRSYDL